MNMKRFEYSKTYEFEADSGPRKHYFFNLEERYGEAASFRPVEKGNNDVIETTIDMDGEVETATLLYYGREYTLRADCFHSKGYPMTVDGRLARKDDLLKDAHLHTSCNRAEIEESKLCHCICCQTQFHSSEISEYTDEGDTAICPYCDCDAVIGDASGIRMTNELLERLNEKYF